MNSNRVIPTLLISNELLFKSKKFKDFNYIGDPLIAVKIFNEKEAQEICILDIEISRNKGEINFELLQDISSECFMPLSYGGGVNNIEDIRHLNRIGYEKVILNSAVHKNPVLVSEAVKEFGSSTIIGCIDYKLLQNEYMVFINGGTINTKKSLKEVVDFYKDKNVGEIFLNNIERDGSMNGLDLNNIKEIFNDTTIPIIVSGGVGSLKDIKKGFDFGANAVAAGSLFVYKGPLKAVLINYPDKESLNKLNNHYQ
tara:strand:- start:657 stop:1421 length:765 start_codon:yes stop_codon:yes gene_type:complete